MIDIPPEVAIKSTIKLGSVYYYPENSFHSSEPHYFIVINIDPQKDKIIFLVCVSSQIEKSKNRRRTCPIETLVEISPDKYPGFKVNSIIDCNYVRETNVGQLVDKLLRKELQIKSEMNEALVRKLRAGVLSSPLIERRVKTLLQD